MESAQKDRIALIEDLAASNATYSIPLSITGIRVLLQQGYALLPEPGPCTEIRFSARVLQSSRLVMFPPEAVATQTIVRLSSASGENGWIKFFGECLRMSNRIIDRCSSDEYGGLLIHSPVDVFPGWWEFALSLASSDGRWFRVCAVRPLVHQLPAYPWAGSPAHIQCQERPMMQQHGRDWKTCENNDDGRFQTKETIGFRSEACLSTPGSFGESQFMMESYKTDDSFIHEPSSSSSAASFPSTSSSVHRDEKPTSTTNCGSSSNLEVSERILSLVDDLRRFISSFETSFVLAEQFSSSPSSTIFNSNVEKQPTSK